MRVYESSVLHVHGPVKVVRKTVLLLLTSPAGATRLLQEQHVSCRRSNASPAGATRLCCKLHCTFPGEQFIPCVVVGTSTVFSDFFRIFFEQHLMKMFPSEDSWNHARNARAASSRPSGELPHHEWDFLVSRPETAAPKNRVAPKNVWSMTPALAELPDPRPRRVAWDHNENASILFSKHFFTKVCKNALYMLWSHGTFLQNIWKPQPVPSLPQLVVSIYLTNILYRPVPVPSRRSSCPVLSQVVLLVPSRPRLLRMPGAPP